MIFSIFLIKISRFVIDLLSINNHALKHAL